MSELGAEVKDMAVPAVALDAVVANLIVLLSDAIAKYNVELFNPDPFLEDLIKNGLVWHEIIDHNQEMD